MAGAASGHYYENYVVMELVKNYAYSSVKANITYYRDSNAKEIDVFVEENKIIHPLEKKNLLIQTAAKSGNLPFLIKQHFDAVMEDLFVCVKNLFRLIIKIVIFRAI